MEHSFIFDAFICHASEDKDPFVRQLAKRLQDLYINVWYDEFALKVGDSLREKIDFGLSNSRYGIVVLSQNFFKKKWPQWELNGLVNREVNARESLILPVWLDVSSDDILRFSPPLADKLAAQFSDGMDPVVDLLVSRIRPKPSPLVVAQRLLWEKGVRAPSVTDEWWLNVVKASNRLSSTGFSIPDDQVWGRWSFPLGRDHGGDATMGEHLGWVALQLEWTKEADECKVSQITRPEVVLEFIHRMPGLGEMCKMWPTWLATYAPQLTIRGFAGEFEEIFDDVLADSRLRSYRDVLALRDPAFLGKSAESIACQFVMGDLGGPHCQAYETFDYLVWLLSSQSAWLPEAVRSVLITGMCEWATWPSHTYTPDPSTHHLQNDVKDFLNEFYRRTKTPFRWTAKRGATLRALIDLSLKRMDVRVDPRGVEEQFVAKGIVETTKQAALKSSRKA